MKEAYLNFFTSFFAERGFITDDDISNLRFIDDVHLDSFEILSMIIEIELAFSVKILPEELIDSSTKTVVGLINLIDNKLS